MCVKLMSSGYIWFININMCRATLPAWLEKQETFNASPKYVSKLH